MTESDLRFKLEGAIVAPEASQMRSKLIQLEEQYATSQAEVEKLRDLLEQR